MSNQIASKQKENRLVLLVVNLNAKLQPMHRHELFEDPIEEKLKELGLGEICGGGTSITTGTGEVEACDIEIELNTSLPDGIDNIISILEKMPIPKGSKIKDQSTNKVGLVAQEWSCNSIL